MGRIVMVLLLVLVVAWVVPSTRAMLVEQRTALVDRVKVRLVPGRLEAMANQIDTRLSRGESMPAPFDVWLRRSFSGDPEDPWGTIYYLQRARGAYTVGSAGPDRQVGTPDDLRVERRLPQ